MAWDPEQYHKFQTERALPFYDLLNLIESRGHLRVIDLGCGTGELTLALFRRLPDSEVVGIDSSVEMLAAAQEKAQPGLRFERRRIEEVAGQWDLVFSHAALQWVEGHETLIPHIFALVAPGGQLAVQLPSNLGSPAHQLLLETVKEAPFVETLAGWVRPNPVLSIVHYAELLYQCGGEAITVFEKIYPHLLRDAAAVLEWSLGTSLRPYLARLPEALHPSLIERYRQKLEQRWPAGPVFYPFQRTLFAAKKPLLQSPQPGPASHLPH
jgi:trans-aconitate 2-methyltransferase